MLTTPVRPRILIRRAICQVLVNESQLMIFADATVKMQQVAGWQWRCTACLEHDTFERIWWHKTATQQGAISAAAEHLRTEHPDSSSW